MPAEVFEFEVRPRGPFSLEQTTARFQRFPEVVDRCEAGGYARLVVLPRRAVRVSVSQEGTTSRALLRVRIEGKDADAADARAVAQRITDRGLGAASDLRPFYRQFKEDELLGPALRHSRGLRISGPPDAFESLVTTVLCQQVNLQFAFSIRRELAVAFGRRARVAGDSWIAFPEAKRMARLSEADLRAFKLSGAKARAVSGLAKAFAEGALSHAELEALPDEEVVERLCTLEGVGRWTAEVVLMRALGRLDAFPAADLGVIKYLARDLLGRGKSATEREMRRFAERWRPYRSLALVYAYAEIEKRKAETAS
ncbi:MAG: hypothetical protein AAF479_15910 [Pseudomonadota bacterium]